MKLYKARVLFFLFIAKILSKILFVEIPPLVSAAAIIKRDGQILLLKFSYLDGFGLPGGLIKEGEDAETALSREVYEETGLKVGGYQYLWSVASHTRGVASLCLFFSAQVAGELRESREGSLHWMSPFEAMNQLAYEGNKIALKKLFGEAR